MPHADEKVAIPPSVIGEFQVDGSKPRGAGVPWNRHAGGKMLVGLPEVRRKAVGSVHDTVTQRILKANGVTKITKKAKEKKAVVIPPGPGMLVAPGAPPTAVAAPPAQPPPTLAGLPAGVGRQKPPTLAPAIEVEDTRTGGCCGLFGGRAPPPRSPALADIKGDTGGGAGPGAGSGGSALGSGAAGSSTSPAGAAARPITASSRGAPSLYDSTFRQANQSIKRGPQSARTRSGGARARSAGSEGGVSNWGDVEEGEFEELQELDEDDEDDLLDDHDPREDEVTALGPGSSRQTTATGEGGEGLQATSVGPSRAGTAKSLALSTYTVASSKAPTKSILKSATSKREQSSNGAAGAHSVDGRVSNGGGAPGGATPSMRVSAGGGGAHLLYGDVASSGGGGGGGGGMVPPGYAPSASALRSDCLNPAVATRPPSELLFGSTPPMGAGLSFVTGGGGGGLFGAAFGGGGSGGGYAPPPAARLSGAGAGGSGSPMGGGAAAAADAAAMAPGAGAASLSAATAARPGNNMMVSAEQLLDMLMAQGKITEDDVQGVMGLGMQQHQQHQQHQPPAGSSLPPPPPQTPQLQAAASVAGAIGPNPFASGGSGSGGQPQTHSCPGHSPGHSATDVPQLMAGQPAPAAAASGAATGGAGPRAVAGTGPGSGLAAHGSLQRDSASRVRFGANQQMGQVPPPGSRQLTHSNSGGPGDLPPPVALPPVASHAVSESVMAASPSGDGGGGSAAGLAAPAPLQGAAQGDLRVRFIDETGMRTGGDAGGEVGSPRVPHSPSKTPPGAMTPMEIGPGPGYNPQSLLSAASAALAQPLAASSAAGLPPSPPRAGPGGEGLATAASSAGGLGHGGGGGARITLSPYTAGSALLAGQPHPQPHPVSAGGAASAARDAHPLPPPLGLGGVGRAGDGTGVLQLRISGGLSPMPTHTHAYGHSSKAPAGFDAAAAAALASPSPPAQQVGHMVAQGVAPPQGPSPMRLTTSGAYAGGPGGVGAGTGGAVLRHNTSGGSGGSASIRVASAGSVASGSTTRSGYVSGQVTGAGGARDAAPAREPSAFGKKVSEAAAAAAAVAAAAGGSTGGGGGMGAVERLAALKLQSHMRGGASAGGASQDGTHGIPGLDGSRPRQPHAGAGSSSKHAGSRSGGGGGAGSSWMSDGGAGNAYHQSRAQAAPQQQHQQQHHQQQHQQGPQAPAPSRPNGGRSVRWTAAVVYEIDPGEVEDVAGRGSNQNAKGGAGVQAAAAGGRGGGASAAADGAGGRGGGWI
ncbi:hypothetical protein CHLRE_17g699050v5 [Chlamydomonas reinhardtii]|uniref:Uncharacterized protein n=1 Tax=Chlamydomonas reinhardtii TaxID=3055 RepID=A0A2K3CNS9_CHLRE|nr:uncharacterized protein CHLRE_17g699050v5 [Chlamydomonas reinhardtii]PNW69942.1 hypothetical protein CHLRE_17g699050v5 [Chlamydomonas reinhardtii]